VAEEATAFHTLVELAQLSRHHAKGLPAQLDVKAQWTGVGFSLFGKNYVAPMSEVVEMLEMPSFTHLPGVADWIKGVANVRGRLLPLTDLAAFLGGKLDSPWRQQRVLVVELDDIYSGLVVDAVYGMQHFEADSHSSEIKEETITESMAPYMQGAFLDESGGEWAVFSPWALIKSEPFFQAALQAG
jgi:twitching motility protein PilI